MVAFLNKDKAYAEIVEIVSKATNKLVLISPYIKLPDDLLERLKYMDSKGIVTIVVCREKDLNSEVKSALKRLKYLELRYDENLHAKCFYNERTMVITSLNLYEHSQVHNREMGILLNTEEDPEVYREALSEAEFIVSRAKRDSTIRSIVREVVKEAKKVIDTPNEERPRKAQLPSRAKNGGYCIRCGESKTFDVKSPYCAKCYRVWNRYKDPDFEEKFCHMCGTSNKSASMNKPVCISCFRKSK